MKEIDEIEMLIKFKKKSGWNYEIIARELGIHSQSVQACLSGEIRND